MSDEPLPEPDRIEGAPHPRAAVRLFGQDAAVDAFVQASDAGRLHSGWLITGPRGVGKATLAWKIAGYLLAGQPNTAEGLNLPPEQRDMRLLHSGAHPRLALIRRPWDDKAKKLRAEITVDAVRGLKHFCHMSATDGGRRVVIVDAADELNRNAANALLKELEEPPAGAIMLLIAHQPSRLLPTIRSRCRVLRCNRLGPEALHAALSQAGFATEQTESLATLADGSAGDAIRLLSHDGLPLYAEMIKLFADLPRLNRQAAIRLAESCTGKAADARYGLVLDLLDVFLSRAARAGLLGEPQTQGAAGEARLLSQIAPHDLASRQWAQLQQDLSERARHGRAVNLDPAALILDMLFKIEETAQAVATA